MESSTAWIWILPGVAVLAGLVIAVRIVRRRATLVDSDGSAVDVEDNAR